MVDIFSALDFIEKRSRAIKVYSSRCVRSKTRLGSCKKCIEICPSKSISETKNGISIDDNCINCGICSSVCPTGAIELAPISHADIYNIVRSQAKNKEISDIHCHRNTTEYKNPVPVVCLGVLSSKLLFLLSTIDPLPRINYDSQLCADCSISCGEQIFKDSLDETYKLLNSLDINLNLTELQVDDYIKKINRREFFKGIFRTNRDVGLEIIDYVVDRIDQTDRSEIRVENHKNLYGDFVMAQKDSGNGGELFSLIKIPTVTGECSLCKACSKLCPTNALEIVEDELALNTNLCISCGICSDVCFFNAVEMQPIEIAEMETNYQKTLATTSEKVCSECKFKFRTNMDTDICPSCSKK